MVDGDAGRDPSPGDGPGTRLYDRLSDVLMTGVAIIVPLIVTLYLITIAVGFVRNALRPFIALLEYFGLIERFEDLGVVRLLIELDLYAFATSFLTELIALAILFGIVVLVGSVGHNRYGERIIDYVDLAITSIPGVGTVYRSFRRMGDVMLDSEAENFQDVKLVQALDDEMYVIGFETSAAPVTVEDATGHEEMITVFLPMAPNPVTGGFLAYVPRENVYDVDMSIEEGVKSILTSGVATGRNAERLGPDSFGDVRSFTPMNRLQDALGTADPQGPTPDTGAPAGSNASGDAEDD